MHENGDCLGNVLLCEENRSEVGERNNANWEHQEGLPLVRVL